MNNVKSADNINNNIFPPFFAKAKFLIFSSDMKKLSKNSSIFKQFSLFLVLINLSENFLILNSKII